jgi:hypothetical protein
MKRSIWGGQIEKGESQSKKKDAHVNCPRKHSHTQKPPAQRTLTKLEQSQDTRRKRNKSRTQGEKQA